MKQKVTKGLTCLLTAMVAISSAVMAAPSISQNGTIAPDSILIDGQAVDPSQVSATFETDLDQFKDVIGEEVLNTIQTINQEPAKVVEVLKEAKVAEGDSINVEKLQLLTKVQDLSLRDAATGKIMENVKNVTLTWEVPNLVEGLGEVRVLHYSTERGVWEILKPESVDFANKAITQHFEDLSPVAVVYVPADGAVTDGAKTGDPNNMALYIAIAVTAVILVAALVFTKKRARR